MAPALARPCPSQGKLDLFLLLFLNLSKVLHAYDTGLYKRMTPIFALDLCSLFVNNSTFFPFRGPLMPFLHLTVLVWNAGLYFVFNKLGSDKIHGSIPRFT